MSTRGAAGIRMNGIDKVGYNHFDSYPSGLGVDILHWLSKTNKEELISFFNEIVFDDKNDVWDDNNRKMNKSFQEDSAFLVDSLFCEYAYIVNLDENVLEFYVGFNKDPNAKGRYAKLSDPIVIDESRRYYGVALKKTFPLDECFKGKYTSKDFED